jgi:PilZ domain
MISSATNNVRQLRRPDNDLASSNKRWKTDWPAELTWTTGGCVCTVLDVSSWGAKVRAEQVPQGQSVSLRIDGVGVVPATVVWRNDGVAGVQFRVQQGWVRRLSMQLLHDAPSLLARQTGTPQHS